MTDVWAWFLGTRVGRGCVVIAALIAAFVATAFVARSKGKTAQKNTDLASAAQEMVQAANAAAKQTQDAAQTRADVEAAAALLPSAPAQKVADADPATATGKLRDEGWTRD